VDADCRTTVLSSNQTSGDRVSVGKVTAEFGSKSIDVEQRKVFVGRPRGTAWQCSRSAALVR
jgi:hypothetical protein